MVVCVLSHFHTRRNHCRQAGQDGDPQAQASMWQDAFFKLAAAAGVRVDQQQQPSLDDIIQQAQAVRHRDPWVQVMDIL